MADDTSEEIVAEVRRDFFAEEVSFLITANATFHGITYRGHGPIKKDHFRPALSGR